MFGAFQLPDLFFFELSVVTWAGGWRKKSREIKAIAVEGVWRRSVIIVQ